MSASLVGSEMCIRDRLSPWSGPKANLDEVEFAALQPDGLLSKVFVVPALEHERFICVEAVPECTLDSSCRRRRLA
eukprot:7749579-Alexandrium_andersonii.AAC.1